MSYRAPEAINEPIKAYAPGSAERASIQHTLAAMAGETIELASIIDGQEVRSGSLAKAVMPHRHQQALAKVHLAGAKETDQAIAAAGKAWPDWSRTPFEVRAAVFLRAADLLAGPWRDRLNAATMLGQSKTVHQAEIDSGCELIDFWRFNVEFASRINDEQPESSAGVWNRMDYRPLEGFVFAVTPFNFTSIAGNLPTSVALMGNTVVWKPASTAMYSAWFIMQLLRAAGLPDGVINLVYGRGSEVGHPALVHRDLGGVHFTGSTAVFHGMWQAIGERIASYRSYPRIVGETGGKNFVLAHVSADVPALATAIIRGGYEYQGQKCSACSRAFVPASLWNELRDRLVADIATVRMGDVQDFGNFMGAVIDRDAWTTHRDAIAEARASSDCQVLAGGETDDREGYFVQPTLIETINPRSRLLRDELFGPIVTAYVYPDFAFEDILDVIDGGSSYGLTGSIFARDRAAIALAEQGLRYTAGNFYINDKPTGAVVGQQPFGGARASGTNDKAGSIWNLTRWVSPRAIKETFVPPSDYRYPFLAEDRPTGL